MKSIFLVGFVVSAIFVGCAGDPATTFCAKEADCAARRGDAFSQSQCVSKMQPLREEAQTAGCGSQLDAYLDCLSSLPCGASDSELDANCGAKAKAVERCAN